MFVFTSHPNSPKIQEKAITKGQVGDEGQGWSCGGKGEGQHTGSETVTGTVIYDVEIEVRGHLGLGS